MGDGMHGRPRARSSASADQRDIGEQVAFIITVISW